MARLNSIKEIENTNLLRLGISEGEERGVYTVRAAAFSQLGKPCRGEELSDADMELILSEDEYVRAKRRALTLLSYADNNERTLKSKLRQRGFSAKLCDEVAAEMVSLGYINELSQLERLVLAEANQKLLGAAKIIPKLCSKGYSISDIKSTLSRLVSSGEIDFEANAKALLSKKLPEGATEKERRECLMKQGYRINHFDD